MLRKSLNEKLMDFMNRKIMKLDLYFIKKVKSLESIAKEKY